jgi:hypothetical protein
MLFRISSDIAVIASRSLDNPEISYHDTGEGLTSSP